MASPFYIFLLFFVLTTHSFSREDVFLEKYVSLIYDVHKSYGTSSVFVLFSRNDRYLEEYTMIHSLSRNFSQKEIFSLIIHFEELNESLKFYREHIVRPLIVVLLKEMSDIEELHENTLEANISYPIWLMIFIGETGEPLCEYCAHPIGNDLHLRFDTEMVVVCCDDPMIKEWWSAKENHTKIANFATWTQSEGLTLLVSGGVYARRNDVDGAGLRVSVIENSGISQGVSHISGFYFGDVLMELKRAMNFTIAAIIPVESFGSFNSINNNWTGIVGQLVRRQTDLGVAEFTMTKSRLDAIGFTLPLLLTRTRLYLKLPDCSGVQWSAYFQAFEIEIWMAIILLLITSSVLLTIIQMNEDNDSPTSLFLENYLSVWGLFCQQGLSDFPEVTPLRIACFSILVSAVVVCTAYSASLTSFLAVSSTALPFTSLTGFINDGSYKLIVIQNSSNYDLFTISNDTTLQEMKKMMKPWRDLPKTFHEGFQQVCEERVAFYTTSVVKQIMNKYINCTIVSVESERVDSLAMAIAADNQYNGVMNYHLQRFQDDGTLNRLKLKYLTAENPTESAYHIVNVWGVLPILSILAVGMAVAIGVLFLEKIYFSFQKYAIKWKNIIHSRMPKMDKDAQCNIRFTTNMNDKKRNITMGYTTTRIGWEH